MKLLVTGGAGFIASNYIRYVLSAYPDYHMINLDKLTYAGNLENLKDIESSHRYTFIKGDICDRNLLDSIECDAIINFAAESHVDRSILDAFPFLETNITGTYNLLEIARKRDCNYLHVSTDEVYGSIEQGFFTEDSPLAPNSPYSASKASSDMLVRSYVETYKIKAIVTRCSNNYGPYQFPEKLIPLVILNAINKKAIPVYGDGMNVRDWIYVGDHCRAIDKIFHKGIPGEVYNVGSRNERTNIELIKLLLDKIAEKDPKKIEQEVGWKPEMDFEEGITRTIEWYISNEQWWQSILSGEYMKYYNVQYGERLKN
jgi:dTDP-glucose 4,6-dehydratase